MTGLARRVVRLFVDSVWLAAGALACVVLAAAAVRAGAPRQMVACLMLLGLAMSLAASVRAASRRRSAASGQ